MKGSFKLLEPRKMQATVTLTMPIEDWVVLSGQLNTYWPSSDLNMVIRKLVTEAERTFWATNEEKQ
jgi:hypothetical protein